MRGGGDRGWAIDEEMRLVCSTHGAKEKTSVYRSGRGLLGQPRDPHRANPSNGAHSIMRGRWCQLVFLMGKTTCAGLPVMSRVTSAE